MYCSPSKCCIRKQHFLCCRSHCLRGLGACWRTCEPMCAEDARAMYRACSASWSTPQIAFARLSARTCSARSRRCCRCLPQHSGQQSSGLLCGTLSGELLGCPRGRAGLHHGGMQDDTMLLYYGIVYFTSLAPQPQHGAKEQCQACTGPSAVQHLPDVVVHCWHTCSV